MYICLCYIYIYRYMYNISIYYFTMTIPVVPMSTSGQLGAPLGYVAHET